MGLMLSGAACVTSLTDAPHTQVLHTFSALGLKFLRWKKIEKKHKSITLMYHFKGKQVHKYLGILLTYLNHKRFLACPHRRNIFGSWKNLLERVQPFRGFYLDSNTKGYT